MDFANKSTSTDEPLEISLSKLSALTRESIEVRRSEYAAFVALFLTAWEFKPVGAKWKLPKDSLTEAGSANPRIVVRMTRRGGLQVCRIRTEVDEVAR